MGYTGFACLLIFWKWRCLGHHSVTQTGECGCLGPHSVAQDGRWLLHCVAEAGGGSQDFTV